MTYRKLKPIPILLTTACLLAFSGPAWAADAQFDGDKVRVSMDKRVHNTLLSISGPGGFYAEVYAKKGAPTLQLSKYGKVHDGHYNWSISAATDKMEEVHESELYSGRDEKAKRQRNVSMRESGGFWVKGGKIVEVDTKMKEPRPKRREQEKGVE